MNQTILSADFIYRSHSPTLPTTKPRLSAIEKARKRAAQNLQTGKVLGEVAASRNDICAEVTADLLKLSGYEKANGELTNLIDKKGRTFSCPQSFISANTVLDTNYQVKTARRHRKRIYEAFAEHLPEVLEHKLSVSFLTPTFPNLLGVGFADNDKFQTLVWEKFLQHKVFGEFFYGGFSKTDFTLGGRVERLKTGRAFDLNVDGINYHFHALCINYKPFAEGQTSQIENKLVYMRQEGKSADEKRLLRNSLKIVSAWTDCLKKAYLELFGKPLKIKTASGRANVKFQNVSLDEIKDYDPDESKNGIFWEIAKTASYTAKGISFRELPPELLLEAENVFKGKRMINAFGVFRKQVQKQSKASERLDNPPTKQSEKLHYQTSNSLFDNALRGECEPLKSYGIRLCSQGLRSTWLQHLEANRDLIIAKRRDALLERFPNAIFKDLSGKSYYGWKALKSERQREKESEPNYDPASDIYHQFRAYQTLSLL